jgi:O-antigen ligase
LKAHPITGVGAGQFINWNGPGRVERWRETHNVWLQVGAETGFIGMMLFAYLVYRGFQGAFATQRALRPRRERRMPWRAANAEARPPDHEPLLTDEERRILDINAKGMIAGLVGWVVCAFFASVAWNWTFYYMLALAVAGREIVLSRRGIRQLAREETPVRRRLAPAV